MIQSLDVFLWNRKVGTLLNYKEYACRADISEVCAENISSEMREVLR